MLTIRVFLAKQTGFVLFGSHCFFLHCVSNNGPTLKRYSSKLELSILMILGRNIQKALE